MLLAKIQLSDNAARKLMGRMARCIPWKLRRYILRKNFRGRIERDLILLWIAMRERPLLWVARRRHAAIYNIELENPLISVIIPTWNRGKLLAERTLPTVLAQTYRNFEIVIVGDCCTDDTAERIACIEDPRIRFINLEKRGEYPQHAERRHLVAGTAPYNYALNIVRGQWVARLDDDEEWEPDHLQVLLDHAQAHDLELVWGKCRDEISPGEWIVEGSANFDRFDIPHSTVLFRTYLGLFKSDINAWKLNIAGDRHRLRRMRYAGVRGGFVDKIITVGALRPGTTKPWHEAEDREQFS